MTDILLSCILITLVLHSYSAQARHKELITWLDSLGNMTGDQIREAIEAIKKGDAK